jgi:hypothetical protein
MKYEISLVSGKDYVTTYNWYEVPHVGDKLSIFANKVFTVKVRLLPTSDSNRVVLFGVVE